LSRGVIEGTSDSDKRNLPDYEIVTMLIIREVGLE
jgi:hypothetical protein